MRLVERVDAVNLSVDRKLNRRFPLLDELINGFASICSAIKFSD